MMQAEVLINFFKIIPETLYMMQKNLGLQKDSFIKYVVCLAITKEESLETDQKLTRFCVMFEALCGKEKCTPNMHHHGHLKDCILDYGPVFSFWCFSFERYNGIMGDYHTNNVNIGRY